jgi:hypothetical protein
VTVTEDLPTSDVLEAGGGRRITPRQRVTGVVVTGAVLFGGALVMREQGEKTAVAKASQLRSLRDDARLVLPVSGVVVAGGLSTDLAQPQLISRNKPLQPGRYRMDVVCIGNGTVELDVTIGGSGQASMLRCKQTAMPQSTQIDVPEASSGLVVERGATTGQVVAWQVVRL